MQHVPARRATRELCNLASDNEPPHWNICSAAFEVDMTAFAFEIRKVMQNRWLYVCLCAYQMCSCFTLTREVAELYPSSRRFSFNNPSYQRITCGRIKSKLYLRSRYNYKLKLDEMNAQKSRAAPAFDHSITYYWQYYFSLLYRLPNPHYSASSTAPLPDGTSAKDFPSDAIYD